MTRGYSPSGRSRNRNLIRNLLAVAALDRSQAGHRLARLKSESDGVNLGFDHRRLVSESPPLGIALQLGIGPEEVAKPASVSVATTHVRSRSQKRQKKCVSFGAADPTKATLTEVKRAPRVGLEPTTLRLTAGCSAN